MTSRPCQGGLSQEGSLALAGRPVGCGWGPRSWPVDLYRLGFLTERSKLTGRPSRILARLLLSMSWTWYLAGRSLVFH